MKKIADKIKAKHAAPESEQEQGTWECECGTRKYSPEDWKHHASKCWSGTEVTSDEDKYKFAEGGRVPRGVHSESSRGKGISNMGSAVRSGRSAREAQSKLSLGRRIFDKLDSATGNVTGTLGSLAKQYKNSARDMAQDTLDEARDMSTKDRSGLGYAEGGMACPPDCPECKSQSIVHAIRKKFFKGGAVDNIEDAYAETYDDRNEEMADGELYDDSQISDQPEDSNEHGDKLKDEDKHGKSIFSKIKKKKAQKGDRGDY